MVYTTQYYRRGTYANSPNATYAGPIEPFVLRGLEETRNDGIYFEYVNTYDADDTNLNIVLENDYRDDLCWQNFSEQLHEEFDSMLESVEKYGGYYIARYETGGTIDIPILQQGANIITHTDESTNWYHMYKSAKNLAANNSVKTGMIWGCQYDNTLKWLVSSGSKTFKELVDPSTWGNYNDSESNATSESGLGRTAGYSEYWKANNIYDLAGNYEEWTLEAMADNSVDIFVRVFWRAIRGGSFSDSGKINLDNRNKMEPDAIPDEGTISTLGFRASLTINIPEIKLDKENINLTIDSGGSPKEKLTATLENCTEDLTWTVETPDSGITISGTGDTRTITASKPIENAVIKVSCGNISTTCTVTVKQFQYITADVIANFEDKTQFYGKKVNYTCNDTESKWRIFYAGATPGTTENNIYLIAEDYIAWDNIGTTLQELLVQNDTYNFLLYNLSETNVTYLLGTDANRFINSPAKNWLQYARSPEIADGWGYSSSLANMRVTAMMLDSKAWRHYCNSTYATYSIGGPTLDLFAESLNETNDTNFILNKPKLGSLGGYNMDTTTTMLKMSGLLDELYFCINPNVTYQLLASPSDLIIFNAPMSFAARREDQNKCRYNLLSS